MNKTSECFGCVCLKGYEMDVAGDYWYAGKTFGACVKKVYDDEE